jgi:hypothetical protein
MPLLGKNKTYQLHNEPVPLSRIPLPKGEVEIYVGDPKKREGNGPPSHPVITVHDELVETGKPELFAVMEKTEDGRWTMVPQMNFKIVGKDGKVRQEAGDHKPLVLEDQDRFSIGIADFIYDAKTGRLLPKVTGDVEIQLDIPQ